MEFASRVDEAPLWVKALTGVVVFSLAWEKWCRYLGKVKDEKHAHGEVANPFMNLRADNHYRRRYVWPGALLIPIRLTVFVGGLLLISAVGFVVDLGRSKEAKKRPLKGVRFYVMRFWTCVVARVLLFCLGFNYIKVKGEKASSRDAPIVVGNHRGPFEGFFLCYNHNCCLVSAIENRYPVVKYAMDSLQFIFVDRRAKQKSSVAEAIKQRATEGGWPQVILFPEGTTTNGKALIRFKLGAFTPGVAVQPVAFAFPNSDVDVDPSWTFGVHGPNGGLVTLALRLMSAWHNPFEVTYLPVAVPTEVEKKDPTLFAERVRRSIADSLGIPCTEHEQEDALLASAALKMKMDPSAAVVEFGKMKRLFHLSFSDAKEVLQKFKKLDTDEDGEITLDDVATLLGLPPNGQLIQSLFKTLNTRDETAQSINFSEFLSGMAKASSGMSSDEKCALCFDAFDLDESGYISEKELKCMLKLGFRDVTAEQVQDLFQKMNGTADGRGVSRSDFLAFLKDNEAYGMLFDLIRQEAGTASPKGDTQPESDDEDRPSLLSSSTRMSFIKRRRELVRE